MTERWASDATTIGSSSAGGPGLAGFLTWAAAHGCAAPGARLANVLLAQKASVWLGDALDLIASQHSILSGWAEAGAELFELDRLALCLLGNERVAFPGGRRIKVVPAVKDLPGLAPTHYLQLALICASPRMATPPQTASFNVLRAWLLVEAMQRADDGNLVDEFLKTTADGLRQAGEARTDDSWTAVVRQIAPTAHSLNAARLHLISVTFRLLADKDTFRPGTAVERFLRAVGELARGNSRPVGTDPHLGEGLLPVPEQSRPPGLPSFFDEVLEDVPPPPVNPITEAPSDPEDDGFAGIDIANVDPDKPTEELVDAARYIHLTSAAHARLPLWSWDVVNPSEATALEQRMTAAYASDSPLIRATAAFTDLSIMAGRSLAGAVQLPIGGRPHPSGEWTVDLTESRICRTPPRRSFHERRMPAMATHVRPSAEYVAARLPRRCAQTLQSLAKRLPLGAPPQQVMALWPDPAISPSKAFLDWLRDDPILWRIRPGMLSSVAPRSIYKATGDWLLARLLTSHATAAAGGGGLPAAASCSAYSAEEVTAALAQWFSPDAGENSAGSLIDAADAFYRSGLARMCDAVDRAATTADYLDHHNLVSLYWDTLLRAGTGARPARGLWQWAHVDSADCFVFIDDKTGIDESAARWVPLPTELLKLLVHEYRGRHVPLVAAKLREEFGARADSVCSALDRGLVWIRRVGDEVVAEFIGPNHRALHADIAAEAPLVMNAFRHRARTTWRRLGCPQEIVDSFLSHSDGSSRTHGDISPRVWISDAEIARPAIDAAFNALNARPPVMWCGTSPAQAPVAAKSNSVPASEGAPDRTGGRWRLILRAARQTVAELALHAGRYQPELIADQPDHLDRPRLSTLVSALGQWTEQQIADLVKDLSRTPSGTPATLGKLRLLFLGHLADRCWSRTGSKPQLRRRTFVDLVRDPPRATSAAIGARARWADWVSQLRRIAVSLEGSVLRTADAAALLLADLILISRIADEALLHDAVTGRIRVVILRRVAYIEWSPGGDLPTMGHGIVRHRISPEAARYVAALQSAEKISHSIHSNVSARLKPLLSAMGLASPASMQQVCSQLCETVDAVNCLELPGNVAAARAGRLRTASRSWPDWTRDDAGNFFCPELQQSMEEGSITADESGPSAISKFEATSVEAIAAARLFCKEIRKVLNSLRQGGVDEKPTTAQRRDMARAVGRLCTKYTGRVAPALLSLGRWCESLFDRRLTGNQLLKISSIRRYFAALSPRFERLAYDVDLHQLDDEDITELYLTFLEMRGQERPSYVLNRLREFHRARSSSQALPEPDWSELSVEDIGIGVSPGFVNEQAYLRVLGHLLQGNSRSKRAAAAMTLFSYRFGLRKAEAAILRVRDLVDYAGVRHVIVEKLKRRDTKTRRGRRVVPLLFELTAIEITLLEELALQGKERAKTDREALLLATAGSLDEIVNADALALQVGKALKAVTGNSRLTEHHLRHSFACVVWNALEVPLAESTDQTARRRVQPIRELLLGEQAIGRRAPWALSSALGHSHPSRSYISYVHLLCERADDLVFPATLSSDEFPAWPSLIDLSQHPRTAPKADEAAPPTTIEPPGIGKIILCIRMLANGGEPLAIAQSVEVEANWLMLLVAAIQAIDGRLGFADADKKVKADAERYAKLSSSGLLSHIHRSAAKRLGTVLKNAEAAWSAPSTPSSELSLHEFCGMVGYRRQFSFWLESQMTFMRVLVQSTGIDRSRLTLIRPSNLAEAVTTLARRTGWRSLDPANPLERMELASERLDLEEIKESRQEPTRFGDPEVAVLHRYSLALEPREGAGIGNRLELVFASLCFWAWLKSRSLRPAASGQPQAGLTCPPPAVPT